MAKWLLYHCLEASESDACEVKEVSDVVATDFKGPTQGMLATVGSYPVATLYEAAGKRGAMDPSIKPIARGMRICGPAVTVQTVPGDNLTVHVALGLLGEGDVLVVSCGDCVASGIWGEIMTVAAMLRQAAGLVTDGAVRDTREIASKGFPVFAKGVTVRASTKHHVGLVNQPVLCGGVSVTPGDIVVGDDDGVVILPVDDVPATVDAARQREEREKKIIQMLEQGKTTLELYGFDKVLKEKGVRR